MNKKIIPLLFLFSMGLESSFAESLEGLWQPNSKNFYNDFKICFSENEILFIKGDEYYINDLKEVNVYEDLIIINFKKRNQKRYKVVYSHNEITKFVLGSLFIYSGGMNVNVTTFDLRQIQKNVMLQIFMNQILPNRWAQIHRLLTTSF